MIKFPDVFRGYKQRLATWIGLKLIFFPIFPIFAMVFWCFQGDQEGILESKD